jgi:hypothetical protein
MGAENRRAMLSEAAEIVAVDRASDYDEPEDSFQVIADFWTVHLGARKLLTDGAVLDPIDVALMMDLLKTARLVTNPTHRDSWIDKAGYAACGYDIAGGIGAP